MPNVGMRKGRPGPRKAKGRFRVLGINSKGAAADLDNLGTNSVSGYKSSDLKLSIGNIIGRGGRLDWGDIGC